MKEIIILLVFFLLLGSGLVVVEGQRTNFVDEESKLVGYAEKSWYMQNIPFVELPDKQIEDVYYYRWSSHKRHLRYTHPGAGYVTTEFVHKIGHSLKFGTINAAAGHHIDESRWIKDIRYVKDYINFWSREGGGNQQYSEWIADASYNAFLVNGDSSFIKSQQAGLINNFNGWSDHFNPSLNLYYISPHDDAMEQSASSVQTPDPYFGGIGYRPSFNGEMYANAMAISKIAQMNNDSSTARDFQNRAEAIRKGIMDYLWDDQRNFFYHMFRDNNPSHELLDTREEIGFFPWRWNIPEKNQSKYEAAWKSLTNPLEFESPFGPTTCEQQSKWFEGNQTNQCCWWNGNSWPYSTGMTLKALASQVKNYGETLFANVDTFVNLFHKYAVTQYRDGKPHVAECHSALYDFWVWDAHNHSEHYAHSTYVDNVLGDLIGILPQEDNTLHLNPLVPSSWKYFIAENFGYHGHNITVLYDADGNQYGTGSGMKVYLNGELVASKPEVGYMIIPIPPPNIKKEEIRMGNYACNINEFGFPMVEASFTANFTTTWQAVDGRVFYDEIPSNRWSNLDSPNDIDWFSVHFGPGRAKYFSQIKLYIYSDFGVGGRVDCPSSVLVEYKRVGDNNWTPVSNQSTNPSICIPNEILQINFDSIRTEYVRMIFNNGNTVNKTFVGFTELEIWGVWPQTNDGTPSQGIYEAEDGYLKECNIGSSESASGGSFVGQIDKLDSSVEFTGVWVEVEGNYTVQVYYANAKGTAEMILSVNNLGSQVVRFSSTSNEWGDFKPDNFVTAQVHLLRGNNVLIFTHWTNSVEIDKILVQE